MIKDETNSNFSKTKGQVTLEYVLLALCLCVIALRTTFTEGPSAQSATQPINLGSSLYSLSISAVLILLFVIWFVCSFCSKKFLYRFTAIEIGLCLFCVAAIVAGFAAAEKRAVITEVVSLLAPPLMAILLVQILDSQSKIKLVLAVIAALGVVSAYQCTEQLFVENQMTIEQYRQAPETILEPLGITPNTLQHWQFEHRLYSKDVRGFFTTSNSAGSFALLASFAAVALFLEKFKNRKSDPSSPRHLLTASIAVAVVFFGLAITRSKGAITASLIAAAMFIAYTLFGNWLKAHKKAILISCLLLVVAAGGLVVQYGLTHGQLPGGNSMLVRWQYWHASAQMYADHPLTGVGPGNFTYFYPHYKTAEALETVTDPHNFLLTILTQYGPLGLIGFLAMIFIPLWRVISLSSPGKIRDTPPMLSCESKNRGTRYEIRKPEPALKKLALAFGIVISAALLLIRPIIMPVTAGATLDVMIYVIFTLYLAPVVAFAVGFWLLTTSGKTAETPNPAPIRREPMLNRCGTVAALSCAVLGVTLHNLIDFAIFEPPVLTAFWAIIACLIAADFHQKSPPLLAFARKHGGQFVPKPAPFVKAIVVVIGLVTIWAYFNYCLIPVAKSTNKIARAHQAGSNGQFEQAHNLLAAAAEDDCLSPIALSLNGRLYLQRFYMSEVKQADLLLQSEKCLLAAKNRNGADFKNLERLTELYSLLAEIQTEQRSEFLNEAFDNGSRAVERYPGCGRLYFKLAQIAEQLGKTSIAIKHYKKAIDIEDRFRRQFKIMYPEREKIISRLGEGKYNFAVERVEKLFEKSHI